MTIRRRIVLATRIFTPEPAAASFRLQALADALTAAGHEVTVLTTAPPAGTLGARHGDEGARPPGVSSRGSRVKRWPVLRDKQGYVRGYLPYLSFDLPLALRLLLTPADVVGMDTATFTPDGPRREPGGYFLYAGNASEWHGADIFIRAMPQVLARHPRSRLIFVGRSPEEADLRELAEDLAPGAVEFRPTMSPDDLAPWERGAVAGLASLVPGQGYDFAYPTKILPALASGTRVIYAGPGPARRDIIQARLGWAVAYDVDAVAEAMVAAYENGASGAERQRLAQWVRQHRSLRRTGEQAAAVVLAALRRR